MHSVIFEYIFLHTYRHFTLYQQSAISAPSLVVCIYFIYHYSFHWWWIFRIFETAVCIFTILILFSALFSFSLDQPFNIIWAQRFKTLFLTSNVNPIYLEISSINFFSFFYSQKNYTSPKVNLFYCVIHFILCLPKIFFFLRLKMFTASSGWNYQWISKKYLYLFLTHAFLYIQENFEICLLSNKNSKELIAIKFLSKILCVYFCGISY